MREKLTKGPSQSPWYAIDLAGSEEECGPCAAVGDSGGPDHPANTALLLAHKIVAIASNMDTCKGQGEGCLVVGRRGRAKGATFARLRGSRQLQVEYLVVAFDDDRRKVKLSLRQADILSALAEDEALCNEGGCVPDLQVVKRYCRRCGNAKHVD